MDSAKEAVRKVAHPTTSSDDKGGTQDKPGLERDLEPKPTKVHLQGAEGQALYTACGKLKGKKAVITGGDSGIGRSVAVLFAMEGAKVAVVYLPAEEEDAQHTKAQVEKNGGEILLIASDLSHSVNCKDVAERIKSTFGTVDILVNNAATRNERGSISDISEEQWASTFRVNIDSYFYLTKFILPCMAKGGSIINSASVDSYIGVPSRLDYATTKGAIIAFTRSLSNDLIKKGIRVNAVAAGPVWTPLVASGVDKPGQKGHGLGNWTPMDRIGQPVEVATSYVFLAGNDSQFMSGQTLHPNGGIVVNG
ncbi:NAD(P)-binding domain protein [Metarhizium album ARSEF 1941]|uniref:Hydroxynaphthalene reductase-like protein Arp2 n=1 Tax=Metarhizium album (strain ARSEF 1941) TaxID=1081103 RepID=A0A0B2WDY3_METAS|nr:NAD(P)-binding domain protein [Metarhizium album ARSEF 1941]KHN94086.1 NAD(P)-binding domain protein [Metarhizium album ARSEF 1941]